MDIAAVAGEPGDGIGMLLVTQLEDGLAMIMVTVCVPFNYSLKKHGV